VIAFLGLPIAQYPDIAPPTLQVSATYPGADAQTVAETVATPLEQEINGVEGMLYMLSQSTADGRASITVTFDVGTDIDAAQVLVQNRVSIAEPRLPEEVRRLGVITQKNSPSLLLAVNISSPDESRDALYLSNYATTQMRDQIARIDGVGQAIIWGARDYSMRVWIDPGRAEQFGLTGGDIVRALRSQNVEVAAGALDRLPAEEQGAFEIGLRTQGRLIAPEAFGDVVIASAGDGRLIRVRDVARVELGALDYSLNSYLDETPSVTIGIFQRPGSNALATADGVLDTLAELARDFPPGVAYDVIYNPTEYVAESIREVEVAIVAAVVLVCLVVFVFLQSWRAAVIPIVAIPISLVTTFALIAAFGFSLNTLSLFGLVLAIGIVVDDAIVVVENVERYVEGGISPREAAHRTMDEVGGALVAIALVLSAVFIPTAFLQGVSGQFYRQFALTIAGATLVSAAVSLTLSPALAAILLKPRGEPRPGPLARLGGLGRGFNRGFNRLADRYGRLTRRLVRVGALMLVIYAVLLALTAILFQRTPTGFIPPQDKGYVIAVLQLPPGASLTRTDAALRRAITDGLSVDGVAHAVGLAGLDGASFTTASNAGAIFFVMDPTSERIARGRTQAAVVGDLFARFAAYGADNVNAFVVPPPPVEGVGNTGGFSMYIQDRAGRGLRALEEATWAVAGPANAQPETRNVFTLFNSGTPEIYIDIDRTRAETLGMTVEGLNEAIEVYIGSAFVNDFNFLGRTFRVTAQADAPFRRTIEDVARLRARTQSGAMAPIGSVATFSDTAAPVRVERFNLYPSALVQGEASPGVSTGQALDAMERLAASALPEGFGYAWTDLSYLQRQPGVPALAIFGLAVLFVFLVLAGQYESWMLPLAIILIVPMCLLSAVTGVNLRGLDNNLLTQIGFVVLIGLASKNAILIVEFARQAERQGMSRFEAAAHAARLRLRPILMTSFAFILGVFPLVLARGAGAELRASLGTAVFAGMIGVTVFGLLFTPVFYVLCRAAPDAVRRGWRRLAARSRPG
jgi:HAE1 family hydrophobic/amphiphilic exporter-1